MLTIEQIADRTAYSVDELTHVFYTWGDWSYEYMIYTGHRHVHKSTFDKYMYLWKNLTDRYSSNADQYKLVL